MATRLWQLVLRLNPPFLGGLDRRVKLLVLLRQGSKWHQSPAIEGNNAAMVKWWFPTSKSPIWILRVRWLDAAFKVNV